MADSLTIATWVAAWAAAATALFALVQIGREWWREHVRRRTVDARIETIAYQLRRQLRSWVGDCNEDEIHRGEHLEKWIRDSQNTGLLGQHLDRAEHRLDDLMALRPDASPRAGRALDHAHVYFLEGTRRLNEYIAEGHPTSDKMWDWARLKVDTRKDLCDCVAELERHVLSGTLVAERDLQQKRDAEDPLNAE